jgi:hypothetical protein
VDDLILNTLGVALGFSTVKSRLQYRQAGQRRRSTI